MRRSSYSKLDAQALRSLVELRDLASNFDTRSAHCRGLQPAAMRDEVRREAHQRLSFISAGIEYTPRIMDIEGEFVNIVTTLEAAQVEYAVVGGFAVAIWGAPRATTDIDLLIQPSDLDAVLRLVGELGFDLEAAPVTFQDGMRLRRVTKIAHAEALTLDLLLVDKNLEPIWESRTSIETEAGPVKVISRDGLNQMKTAANRPQDIGDIVRLREQDR